MPNFFKHAVENVLLHEGSKFTSFKNDKGGPTLYGISLRFLKDYTTLNPSEFDRFDIDDDDDIDYLDIQNLSRTDAIYLYQRNFWDKYEYDRINNYLVAAKIFDLSVNMGGAQAHKCIQRAVRAANGTILKDDGVLGPKSIAAINACDQFALFAALKSEAAGFYRVLVRVDPNLQQFYAGWQNRAYD